MTKPGVSPRALCFQAAWNSRAVLMPAISRRTANIPRHLPALEYWASTFEGEFHPRPGMERYWNWKQDAALVVHRRTGLSAQGCLGPTNDLRMNTRAKPSSTARRVSW